MHQSHFESHSIGMGASRLLLSLLLVAPALVCARVDVVPALLVHEEHLPPIGKEPTFTLAKFVAELLKMQGDEIYANAIPRSRPIVKMNKPSSFKPTYKLQKPKQPAYQNLRINNNLRQAKSNNWSTYTQVIFSPVKKDRLIDIDSTPSTKSSQIDRSSSATNVAASPEIVKLATGLSGLSLVGESLIARSKSLGPISPSRLVATTGATLDSTPRGTTPRPPTTTTTDIVDFIRKELRSQKVAPRPFIASGQYFKKRHSLWNLQDFINLQKKSATLEGKTAP